MGPVAIVGLGLMGGSLARALRDAGVEVVRGVDPDPTALAEGLRLGVITHAAASIAEAAEGASAIVVAAPVGLISGLVGEALGVSDCLVTDLGSAKASVIAGVGAAHRGRFIGGHPVCGGERSGVASSRADLFQGAMWFLTPTSDSRGPLYERLHAMVVAVGARPVAIDAEVHDHLMALVSHLPHVLAAQLIHQAAATSPGGREALRSAGPSFSDLTRVAGANPPLWADILLANRDAVLMAMTRHREGLERVEKAIVDGDREWLRQFVREAADGRERLRAPELVAVSTPWELTVGVPDRPGAISEIATALGHAHINIADLALRPGPPGGTGELVLVVADHAAAAAAMALLEQRGYRAEMGER